MGNIMHKYVQNFMKQVSARIHTLQLSDGWGSIFTIVLTHKDTVCTNTQKVSKSVKLSAKTRRGQDVCSEQTDNKQQEVQAAGGVEKLKVGDFECWESASSERERTEEGSD